MAELSGGGAWQRGCVYLGGALLAVQQSSQVSWVHEDPITKSKRVTNSAGTVVSTIELDPWGGNTSRNSNDAFQPHKYTTYDRDGNGSDEAMHRRYNRWWSRFDQPDPYDGSYNLADPQSFNRYAYVQNDPVNFVDPTGLYGYTVIPFSPAQMCQLFGVGCGIVGGGGGRGAHDPVLETGEDNEGGPGGNTSQPQQQQERCRDVINLAAADTDQGALARLIFQEATGSSRMGSGQNQADEVNAISALVQNRAAVLNIAGITQGQTLGFGNVGGSVADVVYSRGNNPNGRSAIPTQFAGFTPNGITQGIQNRLNHALDSDADSNECFDLQSAIVAAGTYQDPFGNSGGTFGMRTAGSRPLGAPFVPFPQISGSGNLFFGLR